MLFGYDDSEFAWNLDQTIFSPDGQSPTLELTANYDDLAEVNFLDIFNSEATLAQNEQETCTPDRGDYRNGDIDHMWSDVGVVNQQDVECLHHRSTSHLPPQQHSRPHAGSRRSRSRPWPQRSNYYPVYPSLAARQSEGFAIKLRRGMNSGRNLLAYFADAGNEPRTSVPLIIEAKSQANEWATYPSRTEILPAGLALSAICLYWPNHVWGTGLRIFIAEGWTAEQIWRTVPDDARHSKAKTRQWNYLQQAMGREVLDMHVEEDAVPGNVTYRRHRRSRRRISSLYPQSVVFCENDAVEQHLRPQAEHDGVVECDPRRQYHTLTQSLCRYQSPRLSSEFEGNFSPFTLPADLYAGVYQSQQENECFNLQPSLQDSNFPNTHFCGQDSTLPPLSTSLVTAEPFIPRESDMEISNESPLCILDLCPMHTPGSTPSLDEHDIPVDTRKKIERMNLEDLKKLIQSESQKHSHLVQRYLQASQKEEWITGTAKDRGELIARYHSFRLISGINDTARLKAVDFHKSPDIWMTLRKIVAAEITADGQGSIRWSPYELHRRAWRWLLLILAVKSWKLRKTVEKLEHQTQPSQQQPHDEGYVTATPEFNDLTFTSPPATADGPKMQSSGPVTSIAMSSNDETPQVSSCTVQVSRKRKLQEHRQDAPQLSSEDIQRLKALEQREQCPKDLSIEQVRSEFSEDDIARLKSQFEGYIPNIQDWDTDRVIEAATGITNEFRCIMNAIHEQTDIERKQKRKMKRQAKCRELQTPGGTT